MFLGFGLGALGGGVESLWTVCKYKACISITTYDDEAGARTLLNQSDISDFVEKSFNSCC